MNGMRRGRETIGRRGKEDREEILHSIFAQ
jgi:hypothetical protein